MNKALIIFVCFLVIMAILVGAGYVKDRGFFGNASFLYGSISPVIEKAETIIREYILPTRIEYADDDEVAVIRARFDIDEADYYCDILAKTEPTKKDQNFQNVNPLHSLYNYEICDTNYPFELSFYNNPLWMQIVDKSSSADIVVWRRVLFFGDDYESKVMLYSEYLEHYKGKDVSLA